MKKRNAILLICLSFVVLLYTGSYIVNSITGGYWTSIEHFGRPGIMHFDNVVRWQPRYGYRSPQRSEPFGKLYGMPIWLDRQFVHKNYLFKIDRPNTWLTEMPLNKIHPQCRTNIWWIEPVQQSSEGDSCNGPGGICGREGE